MSEAATTESQPEAVGFRNQLRARWNALPFRQRAAIAIALELLLAVLLFFVDHSLGYAVVVISALYWIHRLPRLPWQLAGQAVVVLVFLILGPRSLAATLRGRVRASSGSRSATGAGRCRRSSIVLTILYPFYQPNDVHDPGLRRRGRTSRPAST